MKIKERVVPKEAYAGTFSPGVRVIEKFADDDRLVLFEGSDPKNGYLPTEMFEPACPHAQARYKCRVCTIQDLEQERRK